MPVISLTRSLDLFCNLSNPKKFLLLLCFGIAILALSIIPYSLEHSELLLRISLEQASITCYSIVYLVTIGFGITFSALFAKMYRINKIISSSIKCRRVQISFKETLYPVVIMSLCTCTRRTLRLHPLPKLFFNGGNNGSHLRFSPFAFSLCVYS